MRKTIITFPSGRTAVHLEPDDGYKYISDGENWSTSATLGKTASETDWHDTNDEPPAPPEPEEEATAEDYENALGRFGV